LLQLNELLGGFLLCIGVFGCSLLFPLDEQNLFGNQGSTISGEALLMTARRSFSLSQFQVDVTGQERGTLISPHHHARFINRGEECFGGKGLGVVQLISNLNFLSRGECPTQVTPTELNGAYLNVPI
jgi:hypothetical protein